MRTDSVKEYIKSDLLQYSGGKQGAAAFIKIFLRMPVFRFQCGFRLATRGHGLQKGIGYMLYKCSRTKRSGRVVLPLRTQVGYGLYLHHGGPIIINATTVIGNNVILSQFTTIGSNHYHAATIGDNTYIGPNVCIVENVKIGSNVTIGAGSVVTKDIPDNATAVGNYAKVINYNNPGRYVVHRWPVPNAGNEANDALKATSDT